MVSKKENLSHVGKIRVGKIIDAKGLKGELKVLLFSGEADWQKKAKTLFIQKAEGEDLQPFELLTFQKAGQFFVVRVKGVNDRTSAENMKGGLVHIEEAHFSTTKGEAIYLREILGFTLVSGGAIVGQIINFETNVAQDLLVVTVNAKNEALVPLVKEFLVGIDYKNKTVEMNLPEGLIEVNQRSAAPDEGE